MTRSSRQDKTGQPEDYRLLMVTTVASTAYAFLLPYAAHMRRLGWSVALATSALDQRPGLKDHFDEIIELPWRRRISSLRDNYEAMHQMQALLASGRFDVVHTHTPIASFLVRLASAGIPKRQRPKIIYTAHGFHFHRNGGLVTNALFRLLEKFAGLWTDYLVVINDEDERAARRLRLVPEGHLVKIPGIGLQLADYAVPADRREIQVRFRARHGIPPDAVLIAMVAEFSPGKRHEDLLHAVAATPGYDWHIAFAGEGRLLDAMRGLARELRVEDRCHFLGFYNDVPALLASADISALPSEREGLPRAIMESMMAGVPVIGADSRGIRDLLENNCGLLHAVGDVDGLRMGLERITQSPALRGCLTENARRKIAHYGIGPLLGLHERLYAAALGQRAAAVPEARADLPALNVAELQPMPRRVLVIGAAGSTLVNIRGPIMRGLRDAGCEVMAVASDKDERAETILRSWGIRFQYIPMARTGLSPVTDGKYCWMLTRLIQREEIDVILAYTHKPVLYSAMAKALLRHFRHRRCFALITGLGYAFTDDEKPHWRRLMVRSLISGFYRVTSVHLSGIMFQNVDDAEYFKTARLMSPQLPSLVVRGSGIDVERFPAWPLAEGKVRFVFIARLLAYKGVREFAEAAATFKKGEAAADFTLVGPFDPNPVGIQLREVEAWTRAEVLHYAGPTDDVRPYLREASVYVLPSYYREGTPRTVLEAMATGRAIITADTPGCRETIFELGPPDALGVRRGLNGFLVPARSVSALESAMRAFVAEPGLAASMGAHSRRLAEQYYDVRLINRQMMEFMGFPVV